MRDFFTRKYDDKYKYSIYYLENQKQIICKASRTILTFIHNLSLVVNGVEKYKLVRTKGSAIIEILMLPIKNYRSIEFTILMDNKESIGLVRFKKKKGIELIFDKQKIVLSNHAKGYFSVKKNDEQVALLKREPVAKCLYNRYCVWYEPNMSNLIDILLLLLSINDYLFYCNDWGYNTKKELSTEINWKLSDYASIWPSFKNITDSEVRWRPSDSNNETNIEDSMYLTKIDLLQKKVNKYSIFVIILFVLFILIAIAI